MKQNLSTTADIKKLVDSFYRKVKSDEVIGPIFQDELNFKWDSHIPVMYRFWESILLGSQTYSGNPMLVHITLHQRTPLTESHFTRWLKLWQETVEDLFEGEKATEAVTRAKAIASLIQIKTKASETLDDLK